MRESIPATSRARALERVREITLQVLGDRDARVYLFGSSVTGRLRQSSDIDVAIDAVRVLPSALLAELRERLEESTIPYDVVSMTDDRNLVVHVYREAVASDLDSRLHLHALTLAAWNGAIAA